MRILYVEDNEVNQALVARVSRAKGYEVLFSSEGEIALKLLAEDAAIDLVLLDIELAGVMTGIDVAQTLRKRGDQRPIVAITAYAMMGDRERILAAGCDQYLPKPLVITDILTLFEEYEAKIAAAATAAPGTDSTTEPAPDEAVDSAPDSAPAAASMTPPEMPRPADIPAAPTPETAAKTAAKPPAAAPANDPAPTAESSAPAPNGKKQPAPGTAAGSTADSTSPVPVGTTSDASKD